jgi:sporulation protein YlmC with PRC-barrel domain
MERRAVDVRGAGGDLHLVRDLLDKQLVDRQHDPMGRADGIVLVVPAEGPPRVACVEPGVTVLAGRLGRRLGRWARAGSRRWGLGRGKPFRVPWSAVVKVGIETEVDLDANATPVLAWEHWLLAQVVRYVPSLKPETKEKRDRGDQRHAVPAPEPGRHPRVTGRRVRLHRLLNHEVVDSDGRRAGRVEEVRARVRDGECLVEEYLLGREGLMERLSVADLSLVALRALGARHGAAGRRVPWRQMDLSDPRRPRLRCTLAELDDAQRAG